MSVFVTGDTHGGYRTDFQKVLDFNGNENDYLIVLGDFGFYWNNSECEKNARKLLSKKDYTILFVDGNHENFDILNKFKEIEMFDSVVGQYENDKIYHLKRGHVYNIQGKTFFVMGGADSIDKGSRQDGVSWWKEEIPSYDEYETGLKTLDKYDNKIDYILSHTGPKSVLDEYIRKYSYWIKKDIDTGKSVEEYLDVIIQTCKFKKHFFGHWHDEWSYKDKFFMLYDKIIYIE